jgi:FkbM family methyltransferase
MTIHPLLPGEWLYHQTIVRWLYDPYFYQQLPPIYRRFANYCQGWGFLSATSKIPFGQKVLQTLLTWENSPETLTNVPLTVNNTQIFVNYTDPRVLNVPNQLQNPQIQAILSNFLDSGDTFLDIGANYGIFSLLAAQIVGNEGKVIAVEPQPLLASLLEQSLHINQYSPYQIFAIACGEKEGTINFYIPQGSSGEGGRFAQFSARSSHNTLSVPLKPFDSLFKPEDVRGKVFIKLDVEGSELFFLQGATHFLSVLTPPILMELNPKSMEAANVTIEQLIKQLTELGYQGFIPMSQLSEKYSLSQLENTLEKDVILLA